MPVQVKLSDSYNAKRKRISRIPRIARGSMRAATKKDAYGIIKTFREGIAANDFRLKRLQGSTVKKKRKQGMPKPRTPLYGKGEQSNSSYMNMLRVHRERNGYRIRPSDGKHHSGRVKLKTLFFVHEYGTVIRQKNKVIRIPPRPAFRKSFERYLRKKKRTEPTEEVSRAIQDWINHGRETRIRQMEAELKRQSEWDA
jgi:hypothetical protein